MLKSYIQKKLENYVRKYFIKHPEVKLIAIAGSVGKTSTKTTVATILSQSLRVRMESTNHNTHMSVPLAILGIEYPENIRNIFAWLAVFRAARKRIKQPTDVDVIVQELGTDRVGEIAHFGTYLRPAIGVVTAVTPEHMEFFQTIEAVAQEELALANFSELALINREDIDGRFAGYLSNQNIATYGTTSAAEYRLEVADFSIESGYSSTIIMPGYEAGLAAEVHLVGEHSLRPVAAAVAVAARLGLSPEAIVAGVGAIRAVPGRMNILRGNKESVIIDDTYNSSPAAAEAAIRTLYSIAAPERILVFGDMNELGAVSEAEHTRLGGLCDPSLLSWVVTVGEQSERFFAPAARARGCQVKSFKTALEAGSFANSQLEKGSVTLVKGSEGGIYLEEAVMIMLHTTADEERLVRQSADWIERKQRFFSKFQ